MKTIILLALFAGINYAQVQGCQSIGVLDSVVANPSTVSCRNSHSYAILTITLSATSDTILVEASTDLKDSTVAQQEYGQMAVTDLFTGGIVPVITGNVTTNRRYKIDTRANNIRLKGTTNGADLTYIIQYY
jgi:hypothetical protein